MIKKWKINEANTEEINKIVEEYNISTLLAKILVNKNITKKEEIDSFLTPTRYDFHDPFLLPDMEIAVNRIIKAINAHEKVVIYGDYDVDGITSVTVLKKFFKERGLDVNYYIPNRLDEGYGLNEEAIKQIVDERKYFNDYCRLWNYRKCRG